MLQIGGHKIVLIVHITVGDGNCLPRSLSRLMFGVEHRHAEVRVRLTVEGALNRNRYLNNYYLRSGLGRDTQYTLCELYTSLCGAYDHQNTPDDLTRIYNGDVYNTRVDGAYCGIFQVRQYTVINKKNGKNVQNCLLHCIER